MRIRYLDGIKGIGAIAVFLCHYSMFSFPYPAFMRTSLFGTWFMNGGLAVALFLIISGFSAWLSVNRKLNDNNAIGRIVIGRYLRFAVPFGFVFTILYIAKYLRLFDFHIEAGNFLHSETLKIVFWDVDIKGFCKSLLLSPLNNDFWDAPLWMMKYVFFGTYIALIISLGLKNISYSKGIFFILFSVILLSYWDMFLYGITFGFLLGYFYKYERYIKERVRYRVLGVLAIILSIFSMYYIKGSVEFVNFTVASFLLVGVFILPMFQKILSSRFFLFLGKISFGIFMWHWPIMCSLTSYLYVQTIDMNKYTAMCLTFVPTVCVVILISCLSEKYIENGLSKYITIKLMSFIYK